MPISGLVFAADHEAGVPLGVEISGRAVSVINAPGANRSFRHAEGSGSFSEEKEPKRLL
jgi:hypothetical protein